MSHNLNLFGARQSQESIDSHAAMTNLINRLETVNLGSTTSGSSGVPRVREPRMFDGTAQQVDSFVCEITHSLFLQRRYISADCEKCLYFGFYLKDGSPNAWYTSVIKNSPDLLDDYDAFLAAFKTHFEAQAGAWLCSMIQMFYDGLKDTVKDALTVTMLQNAPTVFDDYVKAVINVDNKLHRRVLERQDGSSKPSNKSMPSTSSSSQQHISYTPYAPAAAPPVPSMPSSSNDVVPMEVNAIRHGPVPPAEKERRRKEGLCFYCGQGKHSISNCPNMSPRAERNMQDKKANPSAGKA